MREQRSSKGTGQHHYSQADLDKIRTQAYFIWEKRGKPAGTGAEDWARAEKELLSKGMIGR